MIAEAVAAALAQAGDTAAAQGQAVVVRLRRADGAVTGVVDAITAVENQEGLRTASLAT